MLPLAGFRKLANHKKVFFFFLSEGGGLRKKTKDMLRLESPNKNIDLKMSKWLK